MADIIRLHVVYNETAVLFGLMLNNSINGMSDVEFCAVCAVLLVQQLLAWGHGSMIPQVLRSSAYIIRAVSPNARPTKYLLLSYLILENFTRIW